MRVASDGFEGLEMVGGMLSAAARLAEMTTATMTLIISSV